MTTIEDQLKVYEAGKLTVLGFGGRTVLDDVNVGAARDEIFELLEQHGTEVLAFDLTGVAFLPSGLLGLLASLHERELEIHLYNPSTDVVEALEITKLNTILQVHHKDFEGADGESESDS